MDNHLFTADELSGLLVELLRSTVRCLELRDPEQIADITFAVFGDDSMTLTDPRESVMLQAREMLRLAWG